MTGPANSQLANKPATVYRHRVSPLSALLDIIFSRGQQFGQHLMISWELMFATTGIFGSDFSNEAFHEDCIFSPSFQQLIVQNFLRT